MMWGFALWAVTHAIVNPTAASLILCSAIAFLALVGAALQDAQEGAAAGRRVARLAIEDQFHPLWPRA